MDQPCDEFMASIKANKPPAAYVSDVFDAEFLRTFEGPTAGRLLSTDRGMKVAMYLPYFLIFFVPKG